MTRARIHATVARSQANGPGTRMVVWFQGCTLGCAGCFNPTTHAPAGPWRDVDEVGAELAAAARAGKVGGLTLSGGEPMQQAHAALELLVRARGLGLSTLMFSGYRVEELGAHALGPAVLAHLDVLIDGRYEASQRMSDGLRGSANQQIRILSARHTAAEVASTPHAEIQIGADGSISLTGVAPLTIRALR